MNENIFIVEEAPEGGFSARALGESIFTEGDTIPELHANIREAIGCHYDAAAVPRVIRLWMSRRT